MAKKKTITAKQRAARRRNIKIAQAAAKRTISPRTGKIMISKLKGRRKAQAAMYRKIQKEKKRAQDKKFKKWDDAGLSKYRYAD